LHASDVRELSGTVDLAMSASWEELALALPPPSDDVIAAARHVGSLDLSARATGISSNDEEESSPPPLRVSTGRCQRAQSTE
jgi:hypothetical protein